jgi:CPA2 family monovalent cation:H+ antiporter-2
VLSPQGSAESAEVVRAARKLNPNLEILARAAFLSGTAPMREAGADEVFSGEAEVALAMVEAILARQGASSDEMLRERERVREELYKRAGNSQRNH